VAARHRSSWRKKVRETAKWRARVFIHLCSQFAATSKGGDEAVKLYLFFALMDTLILLTYPILFIVSKLRKIARNKR